MAISVYHAGAGNCMSITRSCMEGILDAESKILNSAKRPPPSYTRAEMIERMVKGRAREWELLAPEGGLDPAGCDLLLDGGAKKLPDGKLQFTHDPRSSYFFLSAVLSLSNLPTLAVAVTCPTALISCKPSDGAIAFDSQTLLACQQLLENLKVNARSFRHEKVDGTHHVHLLQPEVVAPLISDFLNPDGATIC